MSKKEESSKISVNKYLIIIPVVAILVLMGLCFIPFEKRVSLPSKEFEESFYDILNYRYYRSVPDPECEKNRVSSTEDLGPNDLKSSCSNINTGEILDVIKLSNMNCSSITYDVAGFKSDYCDIFYLKDGKLYKNISRDSISNKKFESGYEDPVDIEFVEGGAITVSEYFTVECYGFGLFCPDESSESGDINSHTKMKIGIDANIRKYSNVCDQDNGSKDMLSGSCIYAEDTFEYVKSKDIIK
ncbi:MAG: hypothetical protein MJ154_02750 [Candidatus Saccharibacteria bacterium]|nr:hypothetical protein [Candidatus Saccharibacteria bacterium]